MIPIHNPAPRRHLQALCGACLASIPWITHPLCRICGRAEACEDCARRTIRHYAACRCAVRYDDAMKEWLARYKYRGHERLAPILAAILASALERLEELLLSEAPAKRVQCTNSTQRTIRTSLNSAPLFQAITSVPLSLERHRERGFNQAESLALHLSEWYGIPYRPMLRRVRHTEKQSLKSRRSRVTDMRGIFESEETHGALVSPLPQLRCNILLVDDVYTTGSTVNECARILQQSHTDARNVRIFGLTWARS
ncbi:ComF family protein [Cohnella yongneupensis]|uniref:ComF family protein n=1 Tax=Cohnella yongneupensis TaxID=425006 RepID=A0ABW0QXZ0_9BACL